jgi:hypothetical protein
MFVLLLYLMVMIFIGTLFSDHLADNFPSIALIYFLITNKETQNE